MRNRLNERLVPNTGWVGLKVTSCYKELLVPFIILSLFRPAGAPEVIKSVKLVISDAISHILDVHSLLDWDSFERRLLFWMLWSELSFSIFQIFGILVIERKLSVVGHFSALVLRELGPSSFLALKQLWILVDWDVWDLIGVFRPYFEFGRASHLECTLKFYRRRTIKILTWPKFTEE